MAINVTVWNEFRHERQNPIVAGIYPEGIHGAIANALKTRDGLDVRTATLDEPNQ
jgi:trehalose utilization protein